MRRVRPGRDFDFATSRIIETLMKGVPGNQWKRPIPDGLANVVVAAAVYEIRDSTET